MAQQRIGGILSFKVNGVVQKAKGVFTYSYGTPQRTAVVGSDGTVHGHVEEGQVPYIEGAITRQPGTNYKDFLISDGDTVTLDLPSGETLMLSDAWNASPGTGTTEAGEMPVRYEGKKLEEV